LRQKYPGQNFTFGDLVEFGIKKDCFVNGFLPGGQPERELVANCKRSVAQKRNRSAKKIIQESGPIQTRRGRRLDKAQKEKQAEESKLIEIADEGVVNGDLSHEVLQFVRATNAVIEVLVP